MVGAKREFPFEVVRRRAAKALKEDFLSIYEVTLNKLKHGALASSQRGLGDENCGDSPDNNGFDVNCEKEVPVESSSEGSSRCYLCNAKISETALCFHCTRACCGNCTRRCDGCEAFFCSVCCTADYGQRDDRSFCFECKSCNDGHVTRVQASVLSDQDVKVLGMPLSSRSRQSTLDHLLHCSQRVEENQSCSMEVA
ncbi:hypothetical protein R1flu_011287 [Riccia fluitans]|uniref:Apoptosis regulatory protein Siva n=1 Tax=Riccia fluitans TaxID=41844 RepID=A0ABD1Z864_9MARC